MNRLAHHQGIHKFFTMLGLALYFSKPVMKHLVHIVDAMITKGFSGTLTDLHHWSFHPNHRTTLSHFFTKSPWDEETLLRKLQQWMMDASPKQFFVASAYQFDGDIVFIENVCF
jgi:hypothetical protein